MRPLIPTEMNETEAVRLLDRFYDGLTTPDEERRLRHWLESPCCPVAYRRDREVMRRLAEPPAVSAPADLRSALSAGVRRASRRRFLRPLWGVAASLALLLVAGMAVRRLSPADPVPALALCDGPQAVVAQPSDTAASAERAADVRPAPPAAPKRPSQSRVRRYRPVHLPPRRYMALGQEADPPSTAALPAVTDDDSRLTPEDEQLLRRLVVERVQELLYQRDRLEKAIAQDDFDFLYLDAIDPPESVVME